MGKFKSAVRLISLGAALLALAGCSSNNSPTQPNNTPIPSSTPVPSSPTPCMNVQGTPCTSTPTLTATSTPSPTSTPTPPFTPTKTPTPTPTSSPTPTPTVTSTATPVTGIGWGGADIDWVNTSIPVANAYLQLNGQPITSANVVMKGPALAVPVTFSYNSPVSLGSGLFSYYLYDNYNYQAGQPYTITAAAGGVTSTVSLTAVGGTFSYAPDGSAVSWTVNGTQTSVHVIQGSNTVYDNFSTGNGISPATIPVSVYATPGGYTLEVDVENLTAGLVGGTLVIPNRLYSTALFVATLVSSPTPTFTSTSSFTPTDSMTPTESPTVTPSATPTGTPMDTGTFTWTLTDSMTPTPTLTPTNTATSTASLTASPSASPTPTATFSFTPTVTDSFTVTNTPTMTGTSTLTPTSTPYFTFAYSLGSFGSGLTQLWNNQALAVTLAGSVTQVWASELNNHRVQSYSSSGPSWVTYGGTASGSGAGQFTEPLGIGVDGSGRVFVADEGDAQVQMYSAGAWSVISLSSGVTGYFTNPSGLALDGSGNVYVWDENKEAIEEYSAGTWSLVNSPEGMSPTNGNYPTNHASGLGVNSAGTTFYTCDYANNVIYQYSSGNWSAFLNGGVSNPTDVKADNQGNVFIADTNNNRIVEYDPNGNYLTQFGGGQLNNPSGLALDNHGDVYVADTSNFRIAVFSYVP